MNLLQIIVSDSLCISGYFSNEGEESHYDELVANYHQQQICVALGILVIIYAPKPQLNFFLKNPRNNAFLSKFFCLLSKLLKNHGRL
jgi:hypothetical protein